ncbi:hypothetical protein Efla_005392 [Eimeria flavescens]
MAAFLNSGREAEEKGPSSNEGGAAAAETARELLAAAAAAAHNAVSPFSGQRLGVSVRGSDGFVRAGCTFDSAAFPCSICAAHVAVARTVTEGMGALVAECALVEVLSSAVAPQEEVCLLRGCCLEWLAEYAHPSEVYVHCAIVGLAGGAPPGAPLFPYSFKTFRLAELLPQGRRLPPHVLGAPRREAPAVERAEMEDGEEADEATLQLVHAALEAAEGSCCWRSGVSVGCAIQTEEGIVTGANVETAALGIGCCAEQSAIGRAAALGRKQFLKVAVVCLSHPHAACHPCGRCLQLLLQAQQQTRAASLGPPPDEDGGEPQLILVMPWLPREEETAAAGSSRCWRLKVKPLDRMGEGDRFMLYHFEYIFRKQLSFPSACRGFQGSPTVPGISSRHHLLSLPACKMAAADPNQPYRLQGYHRHVTSLQLAANHPVYAETEASCPADQVTLAFGDRCLPRLLSQIREASSLSPTQLLEALLCLEDCISNPEVKIRAIELGVVSAISPLLLAPSALRQQKEKEAPKKEEEKRVDGLAGQEVGDCLDTAEAGRFRFLTDSPLQRAGWAYLGGSNAVSPAGALVSGEEAADAAALHAVVLRLLKCLCRFAVARQQAQALRLFTLAGELFVCHSAPRIRLLASELLAGICDEDDGGELLAAAGELRVEEGLGCLYTRGRSVDSHLAPFLCAASWQLPPPRTSGERKEALLAACLLRRLPAARRRMATHSLVPAASRLLWLLLPELSRLQDSEEEAAASAAAAATLERLGTQSPLPTLTTALHIACMLMRLVALLAEEELNAEMAASPEVISLACTYTRILWATGAVDPLNLLCRIGCTREGRQALLASADFSLLLPLLLTEPTERQWQEYELQQRLQVQQVSLERGHLLPVVIQLLRAASESISFQREMHNYLRRRRQVMYEVLGVAAMRPAAASLEEALSSMQRRERDLLQTELDEPHEGWLRYLVDSDYAYQAACTEASQALALMEFVLEQSAAGGPLGGPTGATWARRFVPGIDDCLKKAKNADNLGLRAAASACMQLMECSLFPCASAPALTRVAARVSSRAVRRPLGPSSDPGGLLPLACKAAEDAAVSFFLALCCVCWPLCSWLSPPVPLSISGGANGPRVSESFEL